MSSIILCINKHQSTFKKNYYMCFGVLGFSILVLYLPYSSAIGSFPL